MTTISSKEFFGGKPAKTVQGVNNFNIAPRSERAQMYAQQAEQAQKEAEQKQSFVGQAGAFGKEIGEISGISPTGRRFAAAVSPYTKLFGGELPEETLTIGREAVKRGGEGTVETLVGGISGERKMGAIGTELKNLGVPENVAEGIDIAIDLPLISLGLSKSISKLIAEGGARAMPKVIALLDKPLLDFAPEALKKLAQIDISTPIKEGLQTLEEKGGRAIDFAKKPIEYLGSRFPRFLGMVTGESTDTVELALKNPDIADLGIKQGDVALRKAVQEGGEQSIKVRDAFISGHSKTMDEKVFEGLSATPSYMRDKQEEIITHFTDLLRANRVKYKNVSFTEGNLDFVTSDIKANPGEITKIQAAYDAILKWKKWDQRGIFELKQLIGKLTKFPTEQGGKAKSPMLGRMYGFLNDQVKAELPKQKLPIYEKLNKDFSDNIDMFEDMVDAFNSGDPFTRLAGVLGKNKDSLRMIIDAYEKQTGQSILPIVAGRELAMEKQAAFGFLNPRTWIDILFSPKAQATLVTKIGKSNIPEVMKGGQ